MHLLMTRRLVLVFLLFSHLHHSRLLRLHTSPSLYLHPSPPLYIHLLSLPLPSRFNQLCRILLPTDDPECRVYVVKCQ